MSAPDRLREAASLLRERAEAATPGPWTFEDGGDGDQVWSEVHDVYPVATVGLAQDTEYVATMHPAVGLALAGWLEEFAALIDAMLTWNAERDADDMVAWAREPAEIPTSPAADALADLILGGAQ